MAAGYTAPLKDIRFTLDEVIGLDELARLDGLDSLAPDLVAQILDQAAKFAGDVLAPINKSGDEEGARLVNGVVRMPEGFGAAYEKWIEAGWGTVGGAPEFGGMGLGATMTTVLNEMWQAANMALADGLMLTQGAVEALEAHGTQEQQATYLPKLIRGEWSGTMNLTEPNAGSDVGALRTRAVRENGGYRITGTKIFITHGDQDMSENVIHLVLARTPDAPAGVRGISLFLVPKFLVKEDGSLGQRNDLRVVSLEHKLGHMASPTAVMSYGDNGGAVGYLIGGENQGLGCMFTMMNSARLNVGVQGLAIAERAYQAALDWARQRVQGTMVGAGSSSPPVAIVKHPDVRRMLMDMRAQTEAMRLLCYSVGAALDRAKHESEQAARMRALAYAELMTPIAKGWSTDQGFEVASTGIQIHGGMGYIEETGAAQYLRDARITMIYEGTNGIQALDLVRRKLRQGDGKAAAGVIADMHKTAAKLSASDDEALCAIGGELAGAVEALQTVTDWIGPVFDDDPIAAAAGATPYMRMWGFTAGAWLLGVAAMKARAKLEDGADDTAFYSAKIETARYFAEQYLAPTAALAKPIMTAKRSVMAVPDDAL